MSTFPYAYYNDIDPKVCAWTEELIKAGLIPDGVVDCRSIMEVTKNDVKGFTQCHFFNGISGWAYALILAGWDTKRPVWSASLPCQPLSGAGQRKGEKDERHLWPEFHRLISECHPTTVFGEQVASNDGREWMSGVRADLEALGYAVGIADLCAAGEGAPHIRQRLFWVAQSAGIRWSGGSNGVEAGERRHIQIEGRSSDSRLADRESCNRRLPIHGSGQAQGVESGRRGEIKRLADSRHAPMRRIAIGREAQARESHTKIAGYSGGLVYAGHGGLGNPVSEGRKGDSPELSQRGNQQFPAEPGGGYWSDSILIPCGDGKARRIKPGLSPLVDGLPGRVGLLRGYGNAIVPQTAASFIRAYLLTEANP